MLIVAKEDLLKNNSKLIPLAGQVFVEEGTDKFYKMTHFESSACFINNTLSEPRLLTLTPYDPVFLAIEKIWPLKENTLSQLDQLLEEKDMKLFPYLKDSLEKICEYKQQRGSRYYKPSVQKIVDILNAKYQRLLKVSSEHNISLRKPGLQTNQSLNASNPVIMGIFKQDIDEYFIRRLVDRLQVEPAKEDVPPPPVIREQFTQDNQPKKALMRKSQSQIKSELKKERQIKELQSKNVSMWSFVKKKDSNQQQ